MRKRALLSMLVLLVALPGFVFAQAKTSLNVQSNQSGARVYLNDKLAGYASPNFSTLVVPGNYTITVTKDGFSEFKTTINVGNSPVTIFANLSGKPSQPIPPPSQPPQPPRPQQPNPPNPQPFPPIARHQLSIESNVDGAQVYLNGAYAGRTPFVSYLHPGTYSILLRLDGYEEYSRTVNLGGSYQIRATLSPISLPVFINAANVSGASLYRDSTFIGNLPYRGDWMPGNYTLRIVAPGYADYVDRVFLNGPLTIQVSLSPLIVDYQIAIPELFATLAGRPIRFQDVAVYLDGRRLDSPFGKALPGTHRITLLLGDLRFEADFELLPGKIASIEPFLGVNIR
ncbi:MAG TPA: PEGA domain-containing protein [Rectinemataceae bacterium]|nr:PEGA domain-containing protein [Rectinemataceae bacterium]